MTCLSSLIFYSASYNIFSGMGRKKTLVIAAVATAAAGAAGASVLLRKAAQSKKSAPGIYRGSHTSKTLHQTGCRYYDSRKLTRVFRDLAEALDSGYRPCKICIP